MDFSRIEDQINKLVKLQDGWFEFNTPAPKIETVMLAEDLIQEIFYYSKLLKTNIISKVYLYPMLDPIGVQIEIDLYRDLCLEIELPDEESCRASLIDHAGKYIETNLTGKNYKDIYLSLKSWLELQLLELWPQYYEEILTSKVEYLVPSDHR